MKFIGIGGYIQLHGSVCMVLAVGACQATEIK